MFFAAWHILTELAPWLLLGMLISGVLHGMLPPGFIRRRLQGPGGVFQAVLLGVPLPLCSCGVVPTGIGLKKDGASDGATVGFLISTPQTGVDSVLVSASMLGWPFALFKVFGAAITGLIGGLLADRFGKKPAEAQPATLPVVSSCCSKTATPEASSCCSENKASGTRSSIGEMLQHSLEILHSIWGWLLIGVAVSVAIEMWAPQDFLTGVGRWGSAGAGLAALVISLPLYVCATASVPIAAALVAGGFPTGAALVFLMAGPATNAATLGAIYRQFGFRVSAIYLGVIIVGSIALATIFDALFPATWVAAPHTHEHQIAWWAHASAALLLATIVWFIVSDLQRWRGSFLPSKTIP